MTASTSLVTLTPLALGTLAEQASAFLVESTASTTRKAYAADVAAFTAWADSAGLAAMPPLPTTVGLYLTHLATTGKKVSTIERALASIVSTTRAHGYEWPKGHPAVRDVLRGIRRTLGVATVKKAPVMGDDLQRMVGTLGVDLSGMRDRALLTVGWFGAFRRSELVALDVSDVTFTNDGLVATVRHSKTDQEGQGFIKGLPYTGSPAVCPVRSLKAWLDHAGITHGPIFRSVDVRSNIGAERLCDRSVARIVQRAASSAGITSDVAGHSLRAGFATAAAAKGKSLDSIMRQTGHRSERIARGYIRHASIFTANAASGIL